MFCVEMEQTTKHGGSAEQRSEERVELRYCPRCGVLGVQPWNGNGEHCAACTEFLRWIRGEAEYAVAKL